MKFHVLDEDGFLSIVNADKYHSFVEEDWQLDQLFQHFVDQMNKKNIVIWAASEDGGNEWHIEVLDQPSEKKEFREFRFPINVTNSCLYLCPYSDLTMAAQLESEIIPQKHNSNLKIDVSNGLHEVSIRQMFDVKRSDHWGIDMIHFEIIFTKIIEPTDQKANKVFWWVQ